MGKKLVIVESPAKAKTIEKYLGKDYQVLSSFGHIRDLPSKGMNVDIDNNFEPKYEVSKEKKKVVGELKKAAKAADEVILASDEDREGEAIAWHLCQALGLDPSTTKRIVFHEITKPAIEAAIKSPRTVNQSLFDAQQARRILDRIVGYELSPILWKKVQTGLSAGRVQSVAVRLITEREQEIEAHQAKGFYKVSAEFKVKQADLPASLDTKLPDKATAHAVLEAAAKTNFKIADIVEKPATRSPSAPFTTSSLQQEASRRLGYSVKQTMQLAQRLYEAGHITYMRTDSTSLSGLTIAATASYIEQTFGKDYLEVRKFKTKSAGAQEAHEAIRPTKFDVLEAGADSQQQKLYQLIWRRTLASQMAKAKMQKTELRIPIANRSEQFLAQGEVMIFDGFLKVYGGGKDDVILPQVNIDDPLDLQTATARESFSKPPARYSEASLVRKLEELGIGRPSTYAPTISTIQDRGYIEKVDIAAKKRQITVLRLAAGQVSQAEEEEEFGADRAKLLPTPVAEMVTEFLTKHFQQVLDYGFTRQVEANFDRIADGELVWQDDIREFYNSFHPLVEKAEGVSRSEVSNMREVGVDPSDGKTIYARSGRFGPMLQKGKAEEQEEKPQFAPMPKDASITTVTLDQALQMFKLPRIVGQTANGREIKANIGRFGPYLQVDKMYASLKDYDPQTISEEQAREVIAAKQEEERKKVINEFDGGIRILNGPYGPYITDGKKNARIPKDTKPETITPEQAQEMLAKARPGRKRRSVKK